REALHKLMMTKLNDSFKEKSPSVSPELPSSPMGPTKPLEIQSKDVVKKEVAKKELPLKKFLDRKKKPKEYHVEIAKSETIYCPDCGQAVFGGASGYAGCICFGPDQHRKIWLKKTDDGFQLKFSRGWDEDNISQLLETLRKSNGRH
ncbi:MAG TPA: hypothetical protein VIJ14_00895, partial [Rhabdochlamydiaceae bacterium]